MVSTLTPRETIEDGYEAYNTLVTSLLAWPTGVEHPDEIWDILEQVDLTADAIRDREIPETIHFLSGSTYQMALMNQYITKGFLANRQENYFSMSDAILFRSPTGQNEQPGSSSYLGKNTQQSNVNNYLNIRYINLIFPWY